MIEPVIQGLRVAFEGCGHGTLHAIYASVTKACKARGWDGVDLLIIGGDFQAVRNASDLTVMSCPVKYRKIGDFHSYYSGARKAPYLTLFVGGNHEASSHLWELFYGGWVAPNIYYMGAANVVRLGGVRIAGISGIWKGYDFRKPHYERLPYNADDIRSIYHVREIDNRKLLQIRTQVDIAISHDWPKAIERHGDFKLLFKKKPDFRQESEDGTLGNPAAKSVMDRLRPPYWFSAHLHCKFAATKEYAELPSPSVSEISQKIHNSDEIELDIDDIEDESMLTDSRMAHVDHGGKNSDGKDVTVSDIPQATHLQHPVSSTEPSTTAKSSQKQPSIPMTSQITNKTVRFLSLDKCLPGRKFLQLLNIVPHSPDGSKTSKNLSKPKFEYDPEWLAITRVFAPAITLGDRSSQTPPDLGEDYYLPLIEKEKAWVEENVVKAGKLKIPKNFKVTAPTFRVGMPEIISQGPREYNNPQMQQFCDLIGIPNIFFSTEEEQAERFKKGPAPLEENPEKHSEKTGGKGGRGRGKDHGHKRGKSRGRGRGRGRGR